jgi:hypothetical protein
VSRFARKEPRAQDLREYDGASGAKLDGWLDELGAAAELYELSDGEAVRFAASRLREAARLWWNALGVEGKAAVGTVDALSAAMRKRFQPVTSAYVAREELDALAQGARSVNAYIADFQRLRARLPDMGEADALHAFMRGLRRDIALELRKQRVRTLADAVDLAAHVGGVVAGPASQRPSAAVNQMDIDDGDGAASSLDDRIQRAVLNAMSAAQGSGSSGLGAKMQTQRGYTQERERNAGGRGGGRGGSRSGRFTPRGPPAVPGVPQHVVQQRWDAKQCLRCGQGGHNSHACPNAISASGN